MFKDSQDMQDWDARARQNLRNALEQSRTNHDFQGELNGRSAVKVTVERGDQESDGEKLFSATQIILRRAGAEGKDFHIGLGDLKDRKDDTTQTISIFTVKPELIAEATKPLRPTKMDGRIAGAGAAGR